MANETTSEKERSGRGQGAGLMRTLLVIVGLAILAAAAHVVFGDGDDADEALAAVGLAVLALLLLAAAAVPDQLAGYLSRVQSVSLGSLGIELGEYRNLARSDSKQDEMAEAGEDSAYADTLFDLRQRLEGKLTYLAKHVFATNPRAEGNVPAFLTVGSLREDRYLTPADAKVADDILSMREYELRALGEQDRRTFLAGANELVDTVRIRALSGQVRKALEDRNWTVLPYPQRHERRDLLVQPDKKRGIQHHVVPVFATERTSKLLAGPEGRLAKKGQQREGGGRFIVVPPLAEETPWQLEDGVVAMTLAQLVDEIARPKSTE